MWKKIRILWESWARRRDESLEQFRNVVVPNNNSHRRRWSTIGRWYTRLLSRYFVSFLFFENSGAGIIRGSVLTHPKHKSKTFGGLVNLYAPPKTVTRSWKKFSSLRARRSLSPLKWNFCARLIFAARSIKIRERNTGRAPSSSIIRRRCWTRRTGNIKRRHRRTEYLITQNERCGFFFTFYSSYDLDPVSFCIRYRIIWKKKIHIYSTDDKIRDKNRGGDGEDRRRRATLPQKSSVIIARWFFFFLCLLPRLWVMTLYRAFL